MKARAPGKVVVSGAYAVLEGAPCIVTAVDRYVTADSGRAADHIAREVQEAMPPPYPHIDATELRADDRKLGLGSSAAIVVASLATLREHPCATDVDLQSLYERALLAHRRAQAGGSGVDVASATFGGTLVYYYDPDGPGAINTIRLPDVSLEVWSCPQASLTSAFLASVREFQRHSPALYHEIFARLNSAATQAVAACETQSAEYFLQALNSQAIGLAELGNLANIPIFTDEVTQLRHLAAQEGAVVMPAGAGGGDLALFCSNHPPSSKLIEAAGSLGVARLSLQCGARGVHRSSG